jgi:hypothetical protein
MGIASILVLLGATTLIVSQTWIPIDAMSSSRSKWSPWPTWSAKVGHLVGIHLRDFEEFDRRVQPFELMYDHQGPQ